MTVYEGGPGGPERAADERPSYSAEDVERAQHRIAHLLTFVSGLLPPDPTAAGHARRTQPFYDPEPVVVVWKGRSVGPSASVWRDPGVPDWSPSFTVGRYGRTFAVTWERRRWWDPRGWPRLLVRLEEWWFGDDLYAEQAAREWAAAHRTDEFFSLAAWRRDCKGAIYEAMAERRERRRERLRAWWAGQRARPW